MKRFLLMILIPGLMISLASAGERLYLMVRNPYFGAVWEPSEGDQYLTVTENGNYEGVVELSKNDGFMFYQIDGDDVLMYGPTGMKQIQFNIVDKYQAEFEKDGNSCWLLSKFQPTDVTTAGVEMTVDMATMTGVFSQAGVEKEVYSAIYVWGSDDWGMNYKNVMEMKPSPENPDLFTGTVDIPYVGNFNGDPEFGPGQGDPKNGYYVFLCPSADNLFSSTRFTAQTTQKVVEIDKGEKFETTVLKNVGAPFIFVSHGEMALTLNVETLEFTASYYDASNPGGGDNGDNNGDNNGGDDNGGDDNGGDNNGDNNGGDDNGGDDNGGDDNGGDDNGGDDNGGDNSGVDTVLSAEVYSVFDITGRKVMTTSDPTRIGSLPKGLYIVNDKKITIK